MNHEPVPYTSGRFSVKLGQEDAFISAVEAVADWTMVNFPSVREITLLRDTSRRGGFFTAFRWEDEESIEAWRSDPEFGAHMTQISEHCESVEVFTLQRIRHFTRR
jgi:heme-degrading monooxygenase HmoA